MEMSNVINHNQYAGLNGVPEMTDAKYVRMEGAFHPCIACLPSKPESPEEYELRLGNGISEIDPSTSFGYRKSLVDDILFVTPATILGYEQMWDMMAESYQKRTITSCRLAGYDGYRLQAAVKVNPDAATGEHSISPVTDEIAQLQNSQRPEMSLSQHPVQVSKEMLTKGPSVNVSDVGVIEGLKIIGDPGSGKSTLMAMVKKDFPQLIRHQMKDGNYFYQIPVCRIVSSAANSASGMLYSIASALDEALGYKSLFEKGPIQTMLSASGLKNDTRCDRLASALVSLHVGVLVIDEFQNIINKQKEALPYLLRLINQTKIGLVVIGIESVLREMFNDMLWIQRRVSHELNVQKAWQLHPEIQKEYIQKIAKCVANANADRLDKNGDSVSSLLIEHCKGNVRDIKTYLMALAQLTEDLKQKCKRQIESGENEEQAAKARNILALGIDFSPAMLYQVSSHVILMSGDCNFKQTYVRCKSVKKEEAPATTPPDGKAAESVQLGTLPDSASILKRRLYEWAGKSYPKVEKNTIRAAVDRAFRSADPDDLPIEKYKERVEDVIAGVPFDDEEVPSDKKCKKEADTV